MLFLFPGGDVKAKGEISVTSEDYCVAEPLLTGEETASDYIILPFGSSNGAHQNAICTLRQWGRSCVNLVGNLSHKRLGRFRLEKR
jgi:hypothetical protein